MYISTKVRDVLAGLSGLVAGGLADHLGKFYIGANPGIDSLGTVASVGFALNKGFQSYEDIGQTAKRTAQIGIGALALEGIYRLSNGWTNEAVLNQAGYGALATLGAYVLGSISAFILRPRTKDLVAAHRAERIRESYEFNSALSDEYQSIASKIEETEKKRTPVDVRNLERRVNGLVKGISAPASRITLGGKSLNLPDH